MTREAISLWQETLEALAEHGKTWDHVYCVGIGRDKWMQMDVFKSFAQEFFYRPWLYGGHSINLDLQLYGLGFILVRQEYDGSECWEIYYTNPNQNLTLVDDPNELLVRYGRRGNDGI